MTDRLDGEVHVRVRFPRGGVVLDYRATRAVADRLVIEFGRHGVSVTIDDQVHEGLAALPHAQEWMRPGDERGAVDGPKNGAN
ncbi:hypothetical protein [Nocardia huaxiensis]|uniref:hypothetical protein n=1 Tax=Nocardia huaxiensis TaxID=2755382 RepID=UPI001E5F7CC9|nr:hypothetical protein [Nocardia huaxiensis]UFS97081.1 hypothetical protein LPY97_03870 [Nocardia huaxiensis]